PAPQLLPSFPTRRSSDLISHHTSYSSSTKTFIFPVIPHIFCDFIRFRAIVRPFSCFSTVRGARVIIASLHFFLNAIRVKTFKIRSEEHTSELQSRFDLVC